MYSVSIIKAFTSTETLLRTLRKRQKGQEQFIQNVICDDCEECKAIFILQVL